MPEQTVIKIDGPDEYELEVVGESHYQDALQQICGPRTRDGEEKNVEAILILEDDNKYDKNAVRVDVEGKTVGYLSRSAAVEWREIYTLLGAPETISFMLNAQITGGWEREDSKGNYGVRLDMPTDRASIEKIKMAVQAIAPPEQKPAAFRKSDTLMIGLSVLILLFFIFLAIYLK